MLDPDLIVDAVVAALRSIPELVTALGGDSSVITGHKFAYGEENSLGRTLFSMQSPSILVVCKGVMGGNFDGMTLWKHPMEIYIQPINGGASPPHLWYLIMNKAATAVSPGTLPIRETRLLNGALQVPSDLPSLRHHQAEDGRDFFCGSMILPEFGDQT